MLTLILTLLAVIAVAFSQEIKEIASNATSVDFRGMNAGIVPDKVFSDNVELTGTQYGLDVSTTISSSSASCFVSSGYTFAVPRGYKSTGAVDTQVCNSIKAAYTAGFKSRDAYLFPCPTCSKSAATQMSELVSYLNTNCKTQWSGRIWLDIEGTAYWTTSTTTNRSWYQQLKDSCAKYGVSCGVYSSSYQWSSIFGSTSYCYGSELPLWYAHYDNNPSFSDYVKFGCWATPHAKQYAGDVTVCSMGIDKNYSPAF